MRKSNQELIEETIILERIVMKYKKGLHLAKKFIDSHAADPDITPEMIEAYAEYTKYLRDNSLQGI